MRRREVLALIGGAAAWPRAVQAQQSMRRIAVLTNARPDDPETRARIAAFQQGLTELGWTEGRNVRIDYRSGLGNAEHGRAAARELLGLQPDVIVAQGALMMETLFHETRSVPIVFTNVSDPVGAGFVATLAHPGGNVTGFSQWEYTMGGKWLELLKQIRARRNPGGGGFQP